MKSKKNEISRVNKSSSVWQKSSFALFCASNTVSELGSGFTTTALPILVLSVSKSSLWMGLIGLLETLPILVFGLVAGVLTDRLDRKRLMLIANLLRGIAVFILTLSVLLHAPENAILVAISITACTIGTGQVFFGIASNAAIAQIVGENQVGEAVATLQTAQNLAGMIGPVLAGQSIALLGFAPAFLIDGISYFLSSIGLLQVKRPFQPSRDLQTRLNFRKETLAGILFLWSNPLLRSLSLSWFVINLLTAGTGTLLVYYLLHDLGRQSQDVGYIFALWSVGGAAGSWLMAYIHQKLNAQNAIRFHTGRFMIGAILVAGVCYIAISLTKNTFLIGVLVGCSFGALLAATANSISLRQEVTPDELLGRVMGVARMMAWGANPLGQLLIGVVLIVLSGRITFLFVGLSLLIVGVIVLFSPLRRA